MCGICGIIDFKDRNGVNPSIIQQMTSTLFHRGPDDGGIYISQNKQVGLGHRRLSIIDLSPAGHQPMSNEDEGIWIVFNGEIYNFKDLRIELAKKRHAFKSNADTEVIIHLYEEYGVKSVKYLRGMFAFALWDEKKQKLFLARDRLGIKPLFYWCQDGIFLFASEIKSILQHPRVQREIDPHAVDCYITYGYIPAPLTIFKGIYKLPQASSLVLKDEDISIERYWRIDYRNKLNLSEDDLKNLLLQQIKDSVKSHLISDVPLGAFLSGGIDSSTVVALMAEESGKPIETFSVGFGEGDELDYARLVARHYKTNHHEFVVEPNIVDILPALVWFLDEPLFDNSIFPTYLISQLTREHVTVALSGDGGDELFAGYQWTRRERFYEYYRLMPEGLQKSIERIFLKSGVSLSYEEDVINKARRFIYDTTLSLEDGFSRRTTVSYAFKDLLYTDEFKGQLSRYNPLTFQQIYFNEALVKDEREKMLYVDTMMYLPDDILFKVDRMSMAHALEVRVPLLDYKVVEFAAQIPFSMKLRGLTTKYILKKAIKKRLPASILKQRKQGFTLPFDKWLRGELKEVVSPILLSKELQGRGFFNVDFIKCMLADHASGRQDLSHRLTGLLVFELWARLYMDNKASIPANIGLKGIL